MSCRRKLQATAAAAIIALTVTTTALAQSPAAPPSSDAPSSDQPRVTVKEISPEETGKGRAVTMSLCVEADGIISKAELAKSSGNPRLDEAALKGVKKLKMTPGKNKNGKPVRMCGYPLTIEWRLED